MDDRLLEQTPRGTALYPVQLYTTANSCGQIFVPYHWHREIELIFILQGELALTVDEEKFVGTAGDIFWIAQEALHGMSAGDAPIRYYALVFPMEFLSFELFDYAQSCYLNPLCRKEKRFPTQISRGGTHYGQAWRELLAIAALDGERAPGYQLAVKASLFKFISLLVQDGLLQAENETGKGPSDGRLEDLKAILTYIQQHYSENLSLSDISGVFHLSPKYFSRYFRKNLDRSFVEYLNGFRMERAADFLLNTDLPVGEIAMTVGFDNFSYFIRRFKNVHGCTPSRYRKQVEPSAMRRHAAAYGSRKNGGAPGAIGGKG